MVSKNTIENSKEVQSNFENSSVLITGATGMIGQNLVELLLKMNDELNLNIHIIAHGRSEEKLEKLFGCLKDRADFEAVASDIVELSVEGNVDYIVHTASVTGGSYQHVEFPMRTISIALEGTKNVLDMALEKHCRGLVYLSTLEVYGNTGFDKQEIFETDGGYIDTMNVRSSYSESKRMCENMCASYTKQYGLPTYVARLTSTFGSGVSYDDKRFFSQFAKSIIEKKDIVLKSTGETVRNYCDAEDAAAAFLFMLAKGEPGQAYNVSNMDTEISIKDFALKFIELFPESKTELKFDLSEDATKLGYNAAMRKVLNSEKLLNIGWKPVCTIDDMVRHLVKSLSESAKNGGGGG